MGLKLNLRLAQILGLFPADHLWGSVSNSKILSILHFSKRHSASLLLYSWTMLLIRLSFAVAFNDIVNCPERARSTTDYITANIGFSITFYTGFAFQALCLYRTKRFVSLLKKLHQYDLAYPATSKPKTSFFCCPFLIQNFAFLCATTAFPISLVVGAFLFEPEDGPKFGEKFEGFKAKYSKADLWSQIGVILGTLIVSFWCEAATIFPVIQLAYFIRQLGQHLKQIYLALSKYTKPPLDIQGQYDLFLKMTDMKLFTQTGVVGKGNYFGKPKQFWEQLGRQYLDYSELYNAFSKFSGIYFVILYPIQIISSVSIIYLSIATATFTTADFVNWTFKVIIGMSMLRIWSMCNLSHGLETMHGRILRKMLVVDVDKLECDEEKAQYEKCLRMVKSIPIRLDASGFFTVGRGNIPGIITALVSYIIVLFQFKAAEMPSLSSGNSTWPPPSDFN